MPSRRIAIHGRLSVGLSFLLIGFLVMLLAGCSNSDRIAVKGEVTWADSTPVESGSVVFEPTDGMQGTRVAGRIVDGKFALDRNSGPLPGSYDVKVFRDEPNEALDDPQAFAADSNAGKQVNLELTGTQPLSAVVSSCQTHFKFEVSKSGSQ